MRKQTVLDQIEIARDGIIRLRFAKEIVDDDNTVLAREWHRATLAPGQDIEAQIEAVNAQLPAMSCAPIGASDIARIGAVAPVVWTDDVKAEYAARAAAES
jgi:hypothetical protein